MLVTCPECEAGISELADPCPKCGFPKAGHRSKESCEAVVQWVVNNGGHINSNWSIEDPSKEGCRCVGRDEGRIAKVEARRFPRDAGYKVYFRVECPKCGRLTEQCYW